MRIHVSLGNNETMYSVVTTKSFDKRLGGLPVNLQKRILSKILEVAADSYAPRNTLTKLQGTDGYRLRVGDWRISTHWKMTA